MMQEWLQSEAVCLEYAARSASWLDDFFRPGSGTFQVAYAAGDTESSSVAPNAATSLIAIILDDVRPLWDITIPKGTLEAHAAAARRAMVTGHAEDVLPLRSFGVLPLFSTCYLARLFPLVPTALKLPTYAVSLRRALFALYTQASGPGFGQSTDALHPFLLYSCGKSVQQFASVLRREHHAGHLADIRAFRSWLADDNLLATIVPGKSFTSIDLETTYGQGTKALAFKDAYLSSLIAPDGQPDVAIEQILQAVEDTAVGHVMSEIAASSRSVGRKCDPSSLVFALAILSDRDPARHAALIAHGTRVVLETIQDGRFPSALPFHIDKQGRALFVPSIEIANALLASAITRRETVPDNDLQELLARTVSIESRLLEDKTEVDIVGVSGSEQRIGWCSDRAPSRNRVDSWITVQALAFFLRRLFLLRIAKRSDVLRRYSWIPTARCRPRWDDIVDPDLDLEATPLKERIVSVVEEDVSTRDRSPVFLLYGPPGTSKTSLVQGLAALKGWDLLTLSPSDFIADSLDHIEQRARTIFQDLMNLDHCVVLMDEMDALLRDREILSKRGAGSIIEFVVPALLPKLQQLRDYVLRRHMAVFFVSNYYETIDRAITRGGRIDNHILVLQCGRVAQRELVRRFLDRRRRLDLLDQIIARLDALPCRFVFRDIEQIVNAACLSAPGAGVLNLGSALDHGIQPEVYRSKDRLAAFREAFAFASRLQNRPYGIDRIVTPREAKDFFEDRASTPPELQQFFGSWATDLSTP